jgi:galactosyl transferase GMA12/MNN10 family
MSKLVAIFLLYSTIHNFCLLYGSESMLNIAIVTLYDESFKEVAQYTQRSKQEYAIVHSYDLLLHYQVLDKDRPASWSKILALQQHLDDYDWLFWSDPDSLILNSDIQLESLIDPTVDLIIAQGTYSKTKRIGNFLIRNSPWSKKFLERLCAQQEFAHHPGGEQSALVYLLTIDKSLASHIKIVPQCRLGSHPYDLDGQYKKGDFMLHLYCTKEIRPQDRPYIIRTWYRYGLSLKDKEKVICPIEVT